ncbi:hypothetical protein C8R43DRAFT_909731, partial [Mycena crocata]
SMSLLRLPPELIEQILVEIVSSGGPNTVAAVAACCHLLHDLVHTIWRELFLAVFDDPRPKNALLAAGPGISSPVSSPTQTAYNWHNFTRRIAAANRLHAADPACDFETLVDVIATAAPADPVRVLDPVLRRTLVLPPLLRTRDKSSSSNISWLNQALSMGYPPLLTKRLLSSFDPDGPEFTRAEFEDTPQGKAFSKLVFLRGFIPLDTKETTSTLDHQYATARAIARTRVYNTKYLMPERCWGPFQPLDPTQSHTYTWRRRLCCFVPPDSDSQDADLALRSASTSRHHVFHPSYVFPAPHRVVPDYAFLAAARLIMEANMRDKFEMEVQFYSGSSSQLAAADVGLELGEVVEAMKSLDLVRMGGAPGFWDVWHPEKAELEDETPSPIDKGKSKATDEVEGWDWAGVEGEWRRVVCWLDYRDLLSTSFLSSSISFTHHSFQCTMYETFRIFPMNLRVVRYSAPPRAPPGADPDALIWRLPVIHIEGDSRGTDQDENAGRVVEGTVRMIGDGAVRWSMVRVLVAGSDPEWVTESVQVGDIGSAMGIMGLWTGAEHSTTDPLGPCWAWKVI